MFRRTALQAIILIFVVCGGAMHAESSENAITKELLAAGAVSAPDALWAGEITEAYNLGEKLIVLQQTDQGQVFAIANEFIVRVIPTLSADSIESSFRGSGDIAITQIVPLAGQEGTYKLNIDSLHPMPPSNVEKLISSELGESLKSIEPNVIYRLQDNQSGYRFNVQQWHLRNLSSAPATTPDVDIDGREAISHILDNTNLPKSPLIIQVIDSGLDLTHAAFRNAIWANPLEIAGNGIDDDKNGFVDDINGWNFGNDDNNLTDLDGHGTFVSGIIAARPTDNSSVRGLAPNTQIMTGKVTFSSRLAASFDLLEAFQYGVQNGARIINMSLETDFDSEALRQATRDARAKGVFMVAAAGNDSKDVYLNPVYPCVYVFVRCVGALDRDGSVASYSNYQTVNLQVQPIVSISAPGTDILSTKPGNRYGSDSGTSFAAPMVSAAIALLLQEHPSDSYDDTQSRLIVHADRISSNRGKIYNGNLLNAFASLTAPKNWETANPGKNTYCTKNPIGPVRSRNHPFANSGEQGIDGRSFDTAYTICSMTQLMNISDAYSDRFFRIKDNLDWNTLNNPPRQMIARSKPFNGQIIGEGHTIRGLYVKTTRPDRGALIGKLGPSGKIYNLKLSGVNIEALPGHAAGLILESEGEIRFVEVEGTITGSYSAGGIAAKQKGGLIADSFFAGSLKSDGNAGGISGWSRNGSRLERVNADVVMKGQGMSGGISGLLEYSSSLKASHARVQFGPAVRGGGLVGQLACYSTVEDSYAVGGIPGMNFTGGLLGIIIDANINRSYSRTIVGRFAFPITSEATSGTTGGAIGANQDGLITGIGGQDWKYYCTGNQSPAPPSSISQVYYTDFLAHQPGGGGEARSTLQLQNQSTFNGWPFGSTWIMKPNFSPILRILPRRR